MLRMQRQRVDTASTNNRFAEALRVAGRDPFSRGLVGTASLGLFADPPAQVGALGVLGDRGSLVRAWHRQFKRGEQDEQQPRARPDVGEVCIRVAHDEAPPGSTRLLHRAMRREPSWSRRLVMAHVLGAAYLRQGRVKRAAIALARAADAHRQFRDLARKGKQPTPALLEATSTLARQVLQQFVPPIAAGTYPMTKIQSVVRALPRRRRRRPALRTMKALDAIITLGREAATADVEQRVVESLARLVDARVLFHYARGGYRAEIPQRVHTLSSWTLLQLARTRAVTVRRIRRAPEFWRPEERRPRGVMTVPIGAGVACLARDRAFTRRDLRAVKTILRLLAWRRDQGLTPQAPDPAVPPTRSEGRERLQQIQGLVGGSKPWRQVLRTVWKVAPADCAVLVLGESGTGKEHVARGLHLASPRSHAPFVPVNCGAIHAGSLQSELFGHVRGAFSGATHTRPGRFVEAHRGTLFLDEVGDMPPAMQVALLRVLEEGSFLPLGGSKLKRVDVRVICATNKDLDAEVNAGRFREDLLHRLDVVRVELPPLRVRGDDLGLLAQHLLRRQGHASPLHQDALDVLRSHDWPGNVRELDNVLRASALLSDVGEVSPDVLEHILARRRGRTGTNNSQAGPDVSPRSARLLRKMGARWWAAPRLAQELGVSTRTINRELSSLCDAGLVELSGAARARRYRATEDVCRDSS